MDLALPGVVDRENHAKLILDSYVKCVGKPLIKLDNPQRAAEQLFHADIAVLSHGTEPDPILNYGNERALTMWEMDWTAFTRTPSRLTAEPMEREQRDQFLRAVHHKGYVDNYTGIRISGQGRRFYIIDAVVWNLVDNSGQYRGQAAAFGKYKYC